MLPSKFQPVVSAARDIPPATLVMGTVLGLLSLLIVSGCAEKSAVRAEDREVPLTTGENNNALPYFSPDGEQVVFTVIEGPERMSGAIRVVSASGGEARTVAVGSHQMARGWDPVAKNILAWSVVDWELRWLNDDGAPIRRVKVKDQTQFAGMSRDGKRLLWRPFTGNNLEMMVSNAEGGEMDTLTRTPQWEVQGCFGPGPDEITLVRQDHYNSPTNEMLVWSPSKENPESILPIAKATLRHPCWSPDSRYLAYISDESGNTELWIYDPESRRSLQLTSTPEDEGNPSWSPDNEWLVFSRRRQTSNLFLGDPETYSRVQLTRDKGEDFNPRVSPDGTQVAFYRMPPEADSGILCVASIPEGEVKEFRFPNINLILEQWPLAWSPDGSEVAIAADDGSGNVDVYRVGVEEGKARRVTIAGGIDTGPSWSPDGKTIAYIRLVEGGIEVWAIPATGGIARQISRNPGLNIYPSWSPDSKLLAYASDAGGEDGEEGEEVELWIAPVDAPGDAWRVEARYPSGKGNYPDHWTEDGKNLLVWRRAAEEGLNVFLVSTDGTDVLPVGSTGKGETEDFLEFTEKGKAYMDLCFPGGVHVFADGEEVSNIYKLRVPEILEAGLQANGELN